MTSAVQLVPAEFEPPTAFTIGDFRLELLGRSGASLTQLGAARS